MAAYVPAGDHGIPGNPEAAKAFRATRPDVAAPAANLVAGTSRALRQDIRAGPAAGMDAAARAIRDRFRKPWRDAPARLT